MSDSAPPAAAYALVATVLGERYFLTDPPSRGIRVKVYSVTDRMTVTFDVDPGAAERIHRMVRTRSDLHYEGSVYDEQRAG